jgi:hypothetical protein
LPRARGNAEPQARHPSNAAAEVQHDTTGCHEWAEGLELLLSAPLELLRIGRVEDLLHRGLLVGRLPHRGLAVSGLRRNRDGFPGPYKVAEPAIEPHRSRV